MEDVDHHEVADFAVAERKPSAVHDAIDPRGGFDVGGDQVGAECLEEAGAASEFDDGSLMATASENVAEIPFVHAAQ